MTDDTEPYEDDDEPIEDVRAAWMAGEKGTTSGPRDLNQRAKSIVDRAVARFEGRQAVVLQVVGRGTNATTEVRHSESVTVPLERADQVSAPAYRVG